MDKSPMPLNTLKQVINPVAPLTATPCMLTLSNYIVPFYECQTNQNNCVANCAGNTACQSSCREDHPCGAQGIRF